MQGARDQNEWAGKYFRHDAVYGVQPARRKQAGRLDHHDQKDMWRIGNDVGLVFLYTRIWRIGAGDQIKEKDLNLNLDPNHVNRENGVILLYFLLF